MNLQYIKTKSHDYLDRWRKNKLLFSISINLIFWLVILSMIYYAVNVKLPIDSPSLLPQQREDMKKVTAFRLKKQDLIYSNLKTVINNGDILNITTTSEGKTALLALSQWLHLVVMQNQVRFNPEKINEFHDDINNYKDTKIFNITTEQAKEIIKNKESAFNKSWEHLTSFSFKDFWFSFDTGLQMVALELETKEDKTLKIYYGSPSKRISRVLQWRNQIILAANKYKLDPALIAAQIEQESGGNPNAISPAGAVGLMQLMPNTARGLGVNPFDPQQNIEGGTKYIKMQLDRFGTIESALIAYNAGPSRVGKPLFAETQGYIRNVPALMEKYRPYFKPVEVVDLKPLLRRK